MAADGSVIIDTRLDTKGFSNGVSKLESSASSMCSKLSAGFKKLGVLVAAAFSVRQIIQFGVESSKAARELSDALTGLQSIVEGQGRSFADAQAFIEEYTQDGLIPATNAITAYKNLAARGYDDSQIRQTMLALKDASAFGRQSSLSMGEAVQSATEGLKNENSVLVDNAGVTKNVAKMWEDYAKSVGTTANNLTQQQKIQAEVAGIMEETKFQTGDAAKVAGTLSGQLQQLSFNFNNLKVAVGNIVNPIVQSVLPTINTAIAAFTKLANTAASFVSLFFGKVSTSSGIAEENTAIAESASAGAEAEKELANATTKAGKAAKKALAGFDELNILQSNTGSSSGGSGSSSTGSGGAGTSAATTTVIEDTISPKLQEIAAKIKELIAPLQEISFQPAIKSLKKLWKAFQRLGKVIGDALEWAWTNILVPLAEWGIEEAAPAVIETLAEAFDMLAAVLEPVMAGINGLMDGLQPYIDLIKMQVLLYIDKWKERFRLLKETFEEHGPEIVGILENLGEAFLLLWDIIGPVCEWIQQAWSDTTTYLNEEGAIGVGLLIDTLYGLTEFVNGVFTGDWKRAWGGITTIFSSTSDAIGKSAAALEKATGIHFTKIYNSAKEKFNGVKEKVLGAWNSIKNSKTWTTIQTNLQSKWTALRTNATTKFNGIRDKVLSAWNTIRNSKTWSSISSSVTSTFSGMKKDVTSVFSGMKTSIVTTFSALKNALRTPINGIIRFLNKMISGIVDGINGAIKALNGLKFTVPSWVPGIGGRSMGLNIRTITKPTIPYLAKGAVIPPNAPFMAMLGDQRHGTNIEAPLSTIQEAVAAVIAEQFGDVAAGLFALVSGQQDILAAILSIEIGDTTIGQAAARYSRKMATARGGA